MANKQLSKQELSNILILLTLLLINKNSFCHKSILVFEKSPIPIITSFNFSTDLTFINFPFLKALNLFAYNKSLNAGKYNIEIIGFLLYVKHNWVHAYLYYF